MKIHVVCNHRQSGAPHVYVLTRWSRNLNASKCLQLEQNTCKAFELVSITAERLGVGFSIAIEEISEPQSCFDKVIRY